MEQCEYMVAEKGMQYCIKEDLDECKYSDKTIIRQMITKKDDGTYKCNEYSACLLNTARGENRNRDLESKRYCE